MKAFKEALKSIAATVIIAMILLFYFVALGSYMILTLFVNPPALDKPKD